MKRICVATIAAMMTGGVVCAQKPPLLPEKDVAALANELSGETAKRNLEGIARFHRQRGSKGFHAAAELVARRLREYGLSDVAILEFPADGKIFYGTQRSRPAWDAEFAELKEISAHLEGSGERAGTTWVVGDSVIQSEKLLTSYQAEAVVLAEDSESANLVADLVDVGAGTSDSDYSGKDVKGKLVLVSAQPGAVQDLAVGKFGAVGIVSYAQNQKTAWSGENLDAIRWGHLDTFSANKTFAFMVSLRTTHTLQERLAKGEKIRLHAVVKAGQHAGNYQVVTATIPGADGQLKYEEIAFSCHLDHQWPGANDNASGCATILEVARTLQKLIADGKLARPTRTIRFIFPPEIEGTMALLAGRGEFSFPLYRGSNRSSPMSDEEIRNLLFVGNKDAAELVYYRRSSGPLLAQHLKAVIHMDMVGGGPETKAVFHVTRGPMSLPSFVQDAAWSFAEWVNEESYRYAAGLKAEYPMVSAEGGKEPLRAEYSAYTMGSDHDVYQDSSFGIPAIYLNDWPDRFIHTNLDAPGNIDATKLKRAGFIGAASGYFLAKNEPDLRFAVKAVNWQARALRDAQARERMFNLTLDREACEFIRHNLAFEQGIETSADVVPSRASPGFVTPRYEDRYEKFVCSAAASASARENVSRGGDLPRFRRKSAPKGPMAVFGYDYFEDEWARWGHTTKPKLLEYEGLWGGGEECAYEVLNFADGKRNAQQIRDAVSAEYGPVPLELVMEYLKALEEIGVVEEVK